jgi:hypothetical protein
MTTVGIGTEKGAFFLRRARRGWDLSGPAFAGWRVTTFGRAPSGDHLLATGSGWFGAAIHRSPDLESWEQVVAGPGWPEGGDRRLNHVWTLERVDADLFAGVDDAGLFRSGDDGETWDPVPGFNEHPTRPHWLPGAGGLAAHCLLHHPSDPKRMWVGVSAVGVFHTDDGGASWVLRDEGVEATAPDDEHPEVGHCVHRLALHHDEPETLWRQDHQGVYRSIDGAESWQRIEDGLPSGFGFALAQDRGSGGLFVVPLESDERRMPNGGRFLVYRSVDGGDSWEPSGTGLPGEPCYAGVLRDALATDDAGGVYLGTTAGTVHVSVDAGERWETVPAVLPRILSVRVLEP